MIRPKTNVENKRTFYPCMIEKICGNSAVTKNKQLFVTGYNYGFNCEVFNSVSRKS